MSLGASSQTTDTICLPVSDAKRVLAGALQKKVQDTLLRVYKVRTNLLQSKINYQEMIITDLETINDNHKVIEENLTKQRDLYKVDNEKLTKQLKTAQRTIRITAAVGLLLALGTLIL